MTRRFTCALVMMLLTIVPAVLDAQRHGEEHEGAGAYGHQGGPAMGRGRVTEERHEQFGRCHQEWPRARQPWPPLSRSPASDRECAA